MTITLAARQHFPGCYRSTPHPIVVCGASWRVVSRAKMPVDRVAGMEIAQNAIPTPGLDGAENAPPTTAHKA